MRSAAGERRLADMAAGAAMAEGHAAALSLATPVTSAPRGVAVTQSPVQARGPVQETPKADAVRSQAGTPGVATSPAGSSQKVGTPGAGASPAESSQKVGTPAAGASPAGSLQKAGTPGAAASPAGSSQTATAQAVATQPSPSGSAAKVAGSPAASQVAASSGASQAAASPAGSVASASASQKAGVPTKGSPASSVTEARGAQSPQQPSPEQTELLKAAGNLLSSTSSVVPELLRLQSPNFQKETSGDYEFVPGQTPNGRPLWKKKGGDRWLYFNTDSNWIVGGPSERDKKFNCTNGFVFHGRSNAAALPVGLQGSWTLFDGKGWREDPTVTLSIVAAPSTPGPAGSASPNVPLSPSSSTSSAKGKRGDEALANLSQGGLRMATVAGASFVEAASSPQSQRGAVAASPQVAELTGIGEITTIQEETAMTDSVLGPPGGQRVPESSWDDAEDEPGVPEPANLGRSPSLGASGQAAGTPAAAEDSWDASLSASAFGSPPAVAASGGAKGAGPPATTAAGGTPAAALPEAFSSFEEDTPPLAQRPQAVAASSARFSSLSAEDDADVPAAEEDEALEGSGNSWDGPGGDADRPGERTLASPPAARPVAAAPKASPPPATPSIPPQVTAPARATAAAPTVGVTATPRNMYSELGLSDDDGPSNADAASGSDPWD